ncbi:MAG: HlyD family efflux transporter periplasmic adaptor subunit [Ruminococcus sp.]|jgi:multidrug efflux pump subunit AcrA (membrane-fusion protein)|nr:HlyD family efflux transporter periplasmic adaptor subunit [Ruminococcus sp.]
MEKRKDRIKNAAIIFLVVMLVLTLFSNTIMNISLPQVAVVMPGYSAISEQIRGSGAIEAAASTDIKISDARKIGAIMVSVGDTVEKGQTLFTLSDDDESRIEELEIALETLENEYDKMLLATGKDYSIAQLEIEQLEDDLADANKQLSDLPTLKAAYDAAVKAREDAEDSVTDLEREKEKYDDMITDLSTGNYDLLPKAYITQLEAIEAEIVKYNERKATNDEDIAELERQIADVGAGDLSAASAALKAAQQAVLDMEDQITLAQFGTNNDSLFGLLDQLTELRAKARIAVEEYNNQLSKIQTENALENRLTSSNAARTNLQILLDRKRKELSDLQLKINRELKLELTEIEDKIVTAKKSVTDLTEAEAEAKEAVPGTEKEVEDKVEKAEYALETAKINLNLKQQEDAAASGQSAVDMQAKLSEVERAKAKLDAAKGEGGGSDIKSTVAGVVTSINAVSGQTTAAGETLASIALGDRGYELSFSVSNDQARRVSVGVAAEVMYYWYGEASAKLTRITNDPSDPNNKKLLTFTVTGDVSIGNNLQLAVGERSSEYSSVIPSSAIREDNNGKFVLACEQKSTPFGSRYTAERIPVTVVATNGQQSAIDGSVENGVWIITTSTKPISEGVQVRLKND